MRKTIYRFFFNLTIIAFCSFSPAKADQTTGRPPNVLMICLDDLNDWIGCLGGHPDVQSPNIDRLANRGLNFTNAHCVVPVCSPSRISIMSGLHATTHGSYELGPAYQNIKRLENVPCLQAYFKSNGYLSVAGGKVLHHGFNGTLKQAVDVRLPGRGGPRPKKRMNWPGGAWDWGPYPENDRLMGDFLLAEKAAEALQKKYDKPFFMSIGFFRPHVPMLVPPKWFELYDREKITLPQAPLNDLNDIPANFKGRFNVEPVHEDVVNRKVWRGMVHSYLACISFADHCVGEVMKGLDLGPNKNNTIVVIWSDHGFHLGEKQRWAKRTLWEESTRTPLIFAGPGIQQGVCAEAVSLLDIYPTLIELCHLPTNQLNEGLSLKPQLDNPNRSRSRPVITTSYFGNHAIRTRHWRYIRYADGAEELYDHRSDPDEFTNLANSPNHKDRQLSLSRWLPKNAAREIKNQDRHLPR